MPAGQLVMVAVRQTFAENIAERRKALGWSQEKLARVADLSVAAIRAIEQGTTTDPRVTTLLQLAMALKVEPQVFLRFFTKNEDLKGDAEPEEQRDEQSGPPE